MSLLLALDFGGTKHTAALLHWPLQSPQTPAWEALVREFAPPQSNAQIDLQMMFRMAKQLLGIRHPDAIGVSFGGPVDTVNQIVCLSHHVPGWENLPLARLIQDEFHAPANVDNDANVAGLGESFFGAGKGRQSLLYITVSTGVGGGWVFQGKRWQGANGMAGEIGHTVIDPQGPLCLCGKKGCLERLASGPYMAQDARIILETNPEAGPFLRQLVAGDLSRISGRTLSQAAALGDPLAHSMLKRAADALGLAIGNTANLVNPECFILGGGVTKSGDWFWEAILQAAQKTVLPQVHFEILPAALGDDAPLWGAVLLAVEIL